MSASLGNAAAALLPLMKKLTVVRRGDQALQDGYVTETQRQEYEILGALIPEKTLAGDRLVGAAQGTIPSGGMRLYTDSPDIRLNDIVVDGDDRWKIIDDKNYLTFVNIRVFRVVSDRAE